MMKGEGKKATVFEADYFEKIYGIVNKEREAILKWNLGYLSRRKEVSRILDVGCGLGEFLAYCDSSGMETYGVEISNFAISKASQITRAKISKVDAGSDKLPFRSEFFDAVCAFDVLEHTKGSDLLLEEAYRVLKRGGVFLATTPNGSVILKKLLPYDPTHIAVRPDRFWKRSFKAAGFSNYSTKGCLAFGMPPSPLIRRKLKQLGLPFFVRPLFFPVKSLCATLYISAFK